MKRGILGLRLKNDLFRSSSPTKKNPLSHGASSRPILKLLLISVIFLGSLQIASAAAPYINFTSPTPGNGSTRSETSIYVNVSTNSTENHSAYLDWNNTIIGWWNFESILSSNGTVYDNSTHGNDGQMEGFTSNTTISGVRGQALGPNGVDERMRIDDDPALTPSNITVMFWMNTTENTSKTSSWNGIVQGPDGDGYTNGWRILDYNNYIYLQINFGANEPQLTRNSSAKIPLNEYVHIAFTYNGSTISLYQNGKLIQTGTNTSGINWADYDIDDDNIYMGWAQAYFNGSIDEFLYYKRALTQQEINASYNAGTYRLEKNFTNLDNGTYQFKAYTIDQSGNINYTETREVEIRPGVDTNAPYINFTSPTPGNGTTLFNGYAYVNVSTTDENEHSAFIDWNKTLVGWWNFESILSSNGTVYDNSTHGNDGQMQGFASNTSTTGIRGNAIEFDGDDDILSLPDLFPSYVNDTITVSFWIKLNAKGRDHRTLDFSGGEANGPLYMWYDIGNDCWAWAIRNSTGDSTQDANTPTSPEIGNWSYITITYNGSKSILYENGVEADTITTIKGPLNDAGSSVVVGDMPAYSNNLNGSIDEFMVYSRVLSPQEINASYNAGTYRLERNFTSLDTSAAYEFKAYAIDKNGYINFTETREIETPEEINSCQDLDTSNKAYQLNQSITSSSGVCFNITADNVTLDGGGYWVSYSTGGTGNAILINGSDSATIRNININQTNTTVATSPAIKMIDSTGHNLSNITLDIYGPASPDAYNYGFEIDNTTSVSMSKNTIVTSTTCDYCHGIYMHTGSNDNTIRNIRINTSGYKAYAIYVYQSNQSTIHNATIYTFDSYDYGVYLHSSDNNIVNRSFIKTSANYGRTIYAYDDSDNNLINNCNLTSSGNPAENVYFQLNSDNNNVTNTNITASYHGIYLHTSSRSFIDNVRITNEGLTTIHTSNADNVTIQNIFLDHTRTVGPSMGAIDLNSGCENWKVINATINTTDNYANGLELSGGTNFNGTNIHITTTGEGDSSGIKLGAGSYNHHLYDSTIQANNDYGIFFNFMADNGNITFINTTLSSKAWGSGSENYEIHAYWYLDLHVNDTLGNDIDSANITCYDIDNNQIFTALTNSSGDIVRQTVLSYIQDSEDNKQGQTPHICNVTKEGYFNKSQSIEIEDNTQETITITNTTLPDITLHSPVDGRIYASTSVLVNITNSSNTEAAWYEWNNTNYTYTGAGQHDFKIQGYHNITAYANNTNGTVSTDTITFRIVLTPVNISSCQELDSPNIEYQLNQSITGTTGNCFEIKANNITLNGNGYAITYATSGTGKAIYSKGYNQTTIKNHYINQTNTNRISSPAIYFANSHNNNISNNTLDIYGDYDPDAHNYAINLANSTNTIISKNTIIQSTTCDVCHGIYLESSSSNNTISHNQINTSGNYAYAIYLLDSDSNTIHNATINTFDTTAYGAYMYNSDNNILNQSYIKTATTDNDAYGVYIHSSSDSNLISNSEIITLRSGTESIYINTNCVDNNITNTNLTTKGEGIKLLTGCYRTNINNVYINTTQYYAGIYIQASENGTLKNSRFDHYTSASFDGAVELRSGSDNWRINNTNISTTDNYGVGIYIVNSNNLNATNLIINTTGSTDAESIRVLGSSSGNSITDSVLNTLNDEDVYFYSSGTGTLNFYNVSVTNKTWGGSTTHSINAYWYLDVHVNDTNGNDLENINVTAWDTNSAQIFTTLTNSSGKITRQTLLKYTQNNTATVYSTNYTVNATEIAYATNSTQLNLSTNKAITLTLSKTDVTAPTININTSHNNTQIGNGALYTIDFNFSDPNSNTANCTLYFNGTGYNTTTGISNYTQTDLTANLSSLALGRYDVYINCTDPGENIGKSGVLNITIVDYYLNATISLNPDTLIEGQSLDVSGHINDSLGNNITNQEIHIYINNSEINITSDNLNPDWWNSSWRYRKQILAENLVSSNLNNTIIMLNFSTTNLISEGKMNSDCSDTRFTDSNGNELDYTLETSTCNTSNTLYWVWINLTANSNNTIYAYYDNNQANLPTDYTNPDEDLVLYMHFDNSSAYGESDTKVYDFSKNGNNGSMGNGNEFINTSGKFGGALDLDGTGDYVNITVSSDDLPNNEITVLAWVYPKALTGDNFRTIVSTTGSAAGGYGFRAYGDSNTGKIQFWYRSNSSYHDSTMSDDAITLDKWTFVAVTYNGTLLTYYINGSQSGSASNSDGIVPLSDVYIGSIDFSGIIDFWNGLIDEARVYNRSLSSDEILAIYNSTKDHYNTDQSLTRTDSNGNYNYTFTAPSTSGKYEVKVNISYTGYTAENTASLTVNPNLPNISLNLDPNPVSTNNNVSIYGHVNDSLGNNISDNEIIIKFNGSTYYENYETELLVEDNTSWRDSVWESRNRIIIEGSSYNADINDTITRINFSTLTPVAQSYMDPDCGDVRFIDENSNQLDHVLETSTCNTSNTYFWLWTDIPSTGNRTIYAYYGNSSANLSTSYTNPDNGLMMQLHLDNSTEYGESGSNFYDFSLHDNNQTCSNCPTWNSSGRFGGAYKFDGSDDRMNPSGDTIMTTANQPMTYSAWVKTSDNDGVMIERGGATYGIQLVVNNGVGEFSYRWGGSSITTISGTTLVNDSSWHLITGTINSSGNMSLYIDGASEANGTATLLGSNPADGFGVGSHLDAGGSTSSTNLEAYFNGFIDEVTVYNRSITSDEARALYSLEDNYLPQSLTKTDSNGDYNYTFTAPATATTYEVKVNISYGGESDEQTDTLTIEAPTAGVNCTGFKCFILRASGSPVAIFDALGAVDLAGSLTQSATGGPDANDFIVRNSSGSMVAWIDDSTGDLNLKGSLSENNDAACTPPAGSFFIRGNNSECVAYFNNTGDLWLRGDLRENELT